MIQNKVNKKIYIGSALGHYKRKGQHYYMLRRNEHYNKHLQSSWNKYGESNFEFTVIQFVSDILLLRETEEFYIQWYKTTIPSNGYNHRAQCNTNLGNKWPLASRIKFSESKKGKRIAHINYNEVAKKAMKKVTAVSKTTSEIIYFNSILEASNILDIDKTSISKALHKVIKSAGNYYWNFTEESVSNNPVNSGEVLLKDNPDPSIVNDKEVTMKEQRLTGEESTNKPDTSAGQLKITDGNKNYWINYEEWKALRKFYGYKVDDIV